MNKKWFQVLKAFEDNKKDAKIELDADADETKSLITAGFLKEIEAPEAKALSDATDKLGQVIEKSIADAIGKASDRVSKGKLPITVGRDLELDDPTEGWGHEKVALGNFLKSVHESQNGTKVHKALDAYKELKTKKFKEAEEKAVTKAPSGFNTLVGDEGGILVPEQPADTLMEKAAGYSDIISRCDNQTTGGNSKALLSLRQDDLGISNRFGGIIPYWRSEGDQMTPTKAKFEQQRVELHELYAYTAITDEQIQDSAISLTQWLNSKVPMAIMFKLNEAVVNSGSGAGKPLSLLNSPCLHQVAAESSQPANSVVSANIDNMLMAMPPDLHPNAVFLYNPFLRPWLNRLHYAVTVVAGTENVGGVIPSTPMFVPKGMYGASVDSLAGYPAIPCEFCPKPGDLGDLIFTALNQYLLLTKGTVTSASSIHVRFDYGETAFRWTFRAGGQSWWKKALDPMNGPSGQKVSPIVALSASGR